MIHYMYEIHVDVYSVILYVLYSILFTKLTYWLPYQKIGWRSINKYKHIIQNTFSALLMILVFKKIVNSISTSIYYCYIWFFYCVHGNENNTYLLPVHNERTILLNQLYIILKRYLRGHGKYTKEELHKHHLNITFNITILLIRMVVNKPTHHRKIITSLSDTN